VIQSSHDELAQKKNQETELLTNEISVLTHKARQTALRENKLESELMDVKD
jgi:hypothetical protein